MDCYEIFEDIQKIEAYLPGDITFHFPTFFPPRNILPQHISITPGKTIPIPFDESNLPSLSEKTNTTRGGDYRTVTLKWRDNTHTPQSISLMEQLRYPNHHFIITRTDGRRYLLMTDELTYEMNYSFDGVWLSAEVNMQSETGLQFILT